MASTYLDGGDVQRINKYSREWLLEYQKEQSDMMPYVTVDTDFTAEYKFYPKVEQTSTFKERQQRMETIDLAITGQTRRRMSKKTYYAAEGWDDIDELYGALDISSPLSQQLMYKGNIQKDQIIIANALGVAYEGKDGSTSVAFDTVNKVIDSSGTTGATFAKLKELRLKMKQSHIRDKMYWFVDPYQMGELIGVSELINYDLNSKRYLEKGRVIDWGDIEIVEVAPNTLTLTAGGTDIRETIAFTKNSMIFGLTQDVNMRIKSREPQAFGWALIAEMTAGAVRVRDEAVFKIRCLET